MKHIGINHEPATASGSVVDMRGIYLNGMASLPSIAVASAIGALTGHMICHEIAASCGLDARRHIESAKAAIDELREAAGLSPIDWPATAKPAE
ncbi:hypothetical protein ACFFJB_14825 [Camelimonas abortus]|uniref:FAD dependent oxidoreductase n=1 Tax=Camelimonas abortus TaxID=1017184 RepID=A0ABV7LHI2_9HYPH